MYSYIQATSLPSHFHQQRILIFNHIYIVLAVNRVIIGKICTLSTYSETSQLQISRVEGGLPFLCQLLFLPIDKDGCTAIQNPLRSSLHHQHVTLIIRGRILLVDRHLGAEETMCLFFRSYLQFYLKFILSMEWIGKFCMTEKVVQV